MSATPIDVQATTTETPRDWALEHRAATSPGWVFGTTALISPAIALLIYAAKQKSASYLGVLAGLFAVLFVMVAASPERELDKRAKYSAQFAAGAAAALVARNNKKQARKELGLDE